MAEQYYFMFSEGEYSDYCVEGLYVCDHEVTVQEWEEHLNNYLERSETKLEEAVIAHGKRVGRGHVTYADHNNGKPHIRSAYNDWNYVDRFYDSPEYDELVKWQEENDPEKSFQKLHNMKPVEYTELSR